MRKQIKTYDELWETRTLFKDYICIDTETYGIEGNTKPFLFQFGTREHQFWIDCRDTYNPFLAIVNYLRDFKEVWGYNTSFDIRALKNLGSNNIIDYINWKDIMAYKRMLMTNTEMKIGSLKTVDSDLFKKEVMLQVKENAKKFLDNWDANHSEMKWKSSTLVYGGSEKNKNLFKNVDMNNYNSEELKTLQEFYKDYKAAKSFSKLDLQFFVNYALNDIVLTDNERENVLSEMERVARTEKITFAEKPINLDSQILPIIADITHHGLKINQDYLLDSFKTLNQESKNLQNTLKENGYLFGLSQPLKIKEFLNQKYNLNLKGASKEELLDYEHLPLVRLFLDGRSLEAWKSTYLKRFFFESIDGRFYPDFLPFSTITGRFTSNFQQLPNKSIGNFNPKEIFQLDDDYAYFLEIDYQAQETKLIADYLILYLNVAPENSTFLQLIKHTDLHTFLSEKLLPNVSRDSEEFLNYRKGIKRIIFAWFYGSGKTKLNLIAGQTLHDLNGGNKAMNALEENVPEIPALKDWTKTQVNTHYYIENLFKRIYRFDFEYNMYENKNVAAKSFVALNYICQGGGADILKDRLIVLHDFLRGKKSRIVATVHDSIIFMIHKDEQHLDTAIKKLAEVKYVYETYTVGMKRSNTLKF